MESMKLSFNAARKPACKVVKEVPAVPAAIEACRLPKGPYRITSARYRPLPAGIDPRLWRQSAGDAALDIAMDRMIARAALESALEADE